MWLPGEGEPALTPLLTSGIAQFFGAAVPSCGADTVHMTRIKDRLYPDAVDYTTQAR